MAYFLSFLPWYFIYHHPPPKKKKKERKAYLYSQVGTNIFFICKKRNSVFWARITGLVRSRRQD
jgi:hypothetical protein